jgi:hypothetical protein
MQFPRIFRRFAGIIRVVQLILMKPFINTVFFVAVSWLSNGFSDAILFAAADMILFQNCL